MFGATLLGCVTKFQFVKRSPLVYYNIEMPGIYIGFTPHNSPIKISRAVNTISILKVRKLLLRETEGLAVVTGTVNGRACPSALGYFNL